MAAITVCCILAECNLFISAGLYACASSVMDATEWKWQRGEEARITNLVSITIERYQNIQLMRARSPALQIFRLLENISAHSGKSIGVPSYRAFGAVAAAAVGATVMVVFSFYARWNFHDFILAISSGE